MSDGIEHDGGPQPVADDVWVEVVDPYDTDGPVGTAGAFDWGGIEQFSIINQHLIDAARLEGIRLGLEAAAKVAGFSSGLPRDIEMRGAIRRLDPATIAKEADQ